MSLIACKWIPNFGWIASKSRDRSYKSDVRIRKSFRNQVERLYLWDNKTKYSEGLNEFGLCILSTVPGEKSENKDRSLEGFKIRKALFERTPKDAAMKLIDWEMAGSTVAFDIMDCWLIENGHAEQVYRNQVIVRAYDEEDQEAKESRIFLAKTNLTNANDPLAVLSAISDRSTIEFAPQHSPLRIDTQRRATRTTGQTLLVSKDKTMHYRAIWCSVLFDLEKLNTPEQKTFFEIVSTRQLISMRDL